MRRQEICHCRLSSTRYVRMLAVLFLHSASVSCMIGSESVAANPTRPSVTDNAYLTASGYAEIETGLVLLDNAWSLPALVKLSVSDRIELGAAMSGIVNHAGAGATEVGTPGAQLKARLLSGDWGALATVGRIDWPDDSGPAYSAYPVISLRSLPVSVDATAAVIYSRGPSQYDPRFLYAVAIAPKLDGNLGVYVEIFGLESSESSSTSADAGVSYSLSPGCVLDAAMSTRISGDADKWVIQAGITCVLGKIL